MQHSRRAFLGKASFASSIAFAGLSGELRQTAFGSERRSESDHVARILFNENPLGPSPKALEAINAAGHQFSRYPMQERKKLAMTLRRLHGLSHKKVSDEITLGLDDEPLGKTDLVLGVGSSEVLRWLRSQTTLQRRQP